MSSQLRRRPLEILQLQPLDGEANRLLTCPTSKVRDTANWSLVVSDDAFGGNAQSRKRLQVSVRRLSLGQMNGERKPRSESNGREKRSGGTAFLAIGIVFLAVAIAMIFLGTTAWIAFFIVGVTFLILGIQKPVGKDERPPSETKQG